MMYSRRAPGRLAQAALATALAAVTTLVVVASDAVPAFADSTANAYTWNRPSIVEAGGADYLAWDDQNIGVPRVTKLGSSAVWTPPNDASTANGTGPTVAASHGQIVMAWSDSNYNLHVGTIAGGNGGGFSCKVDINQAAASTLPPGSMPNSFEAVDTPYLTSEGDDGTGRLWLTWVSYGNYINITELAAPTGDCTTSLKVLSNKVIGQTTWSGPALVISGYGTGTENAWLVWSGVSSPHILSIAKYTMTFSSPTIFTEPTHATQTDIGAAYAGGAVWISYCASNNSDRVYYQEFSTANGPNNVEVQQPGAACVFSSYNQVYSGGVGVNYEYSAGMMQLEWADANTRQVNMYRH